MNSNTILTDEQALDTAFELFTELASDNLSESEMTLFNTYFNQTGFVELYDVDPALFDEIDFEADVDDEVEELLIDEKHHENHSEASQKINYDNFVEVHIGAIIPDTFAEKQVLFAKVLLSLNPTNKSSHIQWLSDLAENQQ